MRPLYLLIALTLLQGTLVLVAYWPSQETQLMYRPVLDFRASDIVEIELTDPQQLQRTSKPLKLRRMGPSEWAVASLEGYPARADRVKTLLDRLSGLKVQTPISSDPSKHDSLGVGTLRFGKKIRLTTETSSVVFLVGQGKGNSIHLRIEGSDDVYLTHGITAWRISSDQGDYIERIFFEFQPPTLQGLTVRSPTDAYQLKISNGLFSSPDLSPDQRLKQDAITHTVNKVSRLVAREALGASVPLGFGPDEVTTVTFQFINSDQGVEERTLTMGLPQGALIPVKDSSAPFYALVSVSGVKGLVNSQLENYIVSTP